MTRWLVVAVVALATLAHADEQAFRAAGELAAKDDPRAVEAFEAVGTMRPITRWTDDAWVEAARIAEKRSDYDRARRNLEQAIAISTDAQLARRAKRDLERIAQMAGGGGEWSAVAAEHQRLVTAIGRGGDPTEELEELEALARKHPAYPRGVPLRITIARGWEEEDEVERALGWLREAVRIEEDVGRKAAEPQSRVSSAARIELIRMLTRNRELEEAGRELALLTDLGTKRSLQRKLEAAEAQRVVRWCVTALLLVLLGVAAFLVRRRSGSWRAAARIAMRPPIEVLYFVPIAAVVGLVSTTGNPLVAKAVIWIFIGAAVIGWISGATLESARRVGPIGMRHAIAHALIVGVAILGAVYLAIDHARLIDLVGETWRTGPGH